jgi:hypothetical protein
MYHDRCTLIFDCGNPCYTLATLATCLPVHDLYLTVPPWVKFSLRFGILVTDCRPQFETNNPQCLISNTISLRLLLPPPSILPVQIVGAIDDMLSNKTVKATGRLVWGL